MKPMKHRGFKHAHNPKPKMQLMPASKVETILHGAPLADIHREERLTKEIERNKAIHQAAKMQREENRKLIYVQKQEELKMSALRESLEKALAAKEARAAKLQSTLDDWSDDEDTRAPVVIDTKQTKEKEVATVEKPQSISKTTFDYILNNPRHTAKQVVDVLYKMYGFNPSSTTSLIAQMLRAGLLSRADGKLYPMVSAYTPIPSPPKNPKPKASTAQPSDFNNFQAVKPKDTGGIAALASKPDVAHNITSLLDNISVNEARALYMELKKLFGNN